MATTRKTQYRPIKKNNRYRFKYGKEGKFAFLAALVTVVAAVVLLLVWRSNTMQTLSVDTFYTGVTVDGIALEGMTYDEADQLISAQVKKKLSDISIKITFNPREYNLTGEQKEWVYDYAGLVLNNNEAELNAVINSIVKPKLDQAYAQGRTGTSSERLEQIRDMAKNGWTTDSSLSYDLLTPLRQELEAMKQEVDVPAINASYVYNNGSFTYTPEQNGWSLNVDGVLKQVEALLEDSSRVDMTLKLESSPAAYTVEQLKQASSLIASFSTNYASSITNRKLNVQKALSAFDGKIVLPGEEISFNATTGERTAANGYHTAPVIASDKGLVDDYGGGVCQVSTTLYMAAKRARMNITERYHHSYPSSYVDKGLDASVNWPYADFKFKNNRSLPIYIRTHWTDKDIYVEIYGLKQEHDGNIDYVSELVSSTPEPEYETIQDKDGKYVQYKDEVKVVVQSRAGYTVNVYEVITDDQGNEISRKKAYTDDYAQIKGKKYVGVKDRPATPEGEGGTEDPTPEITPEPTPEQDY